MPDTSEAPRNQNQMLVYALAAIVVLLVAIVIVLVFSNKSATTAGTAGVPAGTAPAQTNPGAGANPSPPTISAPVTVPQPPAGFDPAKATAVPASTKPEAFVDAYYKAILSGDWSAALKSLPADQQKGETVASYKNRVSGYGTSGYKITSAQTQGNLFVVVVDQVTPSGTITNAWVFQKYKGGYVVAAKKVTGMK
jgi:hypothetical protein